MRLVRELTRRPALMAAAWIAACFSLGTVVYLGWLYRLMTLCEGVWPDLVSMVAGYLAQAAGVALYLRASDRVDGARLLRGSLAAMLVCALPAVLSASRPAVVLFGLLANLPMGVLGGAYLCALWRRVDANWRARVFGAGYGVSTLLVGLLSLVRGGAALRGVGALVTAALFAAAAWLWRPRDEGEKTPEEGAAPPRALFVLALATVLLMSLVKNLGFAFPSGDILDGVSLELSRLFYGVGLLLAGLAFDRNRRQGAVCALAALVLPFVMLSFESEAVPRFLCWSLDYLFYGFFAVFRVALFMELADRSQSLSLAALGLLVGRVGDALGTLACLGLEGRPLALIALTALGFALTVLVFFRLYALLYEPRNVQARSEREVFDTFAMQHDLSAREKEVLRLLLKELTNGEMAAALNVSESTVKFHVHNLLQKSGAKNRRELLSQYQTALYAGTGKAL